MTDREQFEAWCKTVVDPEILAVGPEVALKIWQAARAAPAQQDEERWPDQNWEETRPAAPAQPAERVLLRRLNSGDWNDATGDTVRLSGYEYAWATIERINQPDDML